MRRYLTLTVAAAAVATTILAALARPARAGDMDITPERLYLQPPGPPGTDCQSIAANPEQVLHAPFPAGALPNDYACRPNNVAWANVMSELGMAIAPPAFHPARTTGPGGFALSFEATFTHINANAVDSTGTQYWHQATRGPVDPSTNRDSVTNTNPDSIIQVYSLKARKGLPYGLELTGALGYVANTSMWVGGGDVHWALLEGFRTGFLGYLPDVAIGGGVRTLGGSPKFFLTTVGIDAQISKPFTLADSAVLTPYLGAQRIIIFADSSAVDLTPNVDPLQQCGWEGTNTPGNPNAPGNQTGVYDGSAVCKNKLSNGVSNDSDFNNDRSFDRIRVHRWRAIAGVDYRYEILSLAAQLATDITDPSAENADLGISGSRQWSLSLEAGVSF